MNKETVRGSGVRTDNGLITRNGKKRANGEGHIQRVGRVWHGRAWVFCPDSGRKRYAFFTGKTRAEVAEKISEARKVHDYMKTKTVTVSEWLEMWMSNYMADRRTTTRETYQRMIHLHILPHLGTHSLNALTTDLVSTAMARMGANLAPKSMQLVYAILTGSIQQAVVSGYAWRNVMHSVSKPRVEEKEHQIFSRGELKRFIEAARSSPRCLFFLLCLSAGLRRGEALGLKWSDVNLQRGEITIRESVVRTARGFEVNPPKTKSSRRTLRLPEYVIAALKKVPASERKGLVTKTTSGDPVHPDRVSAEFKKLCRSAGLPRLKLHELRHTHVSHLIAEGISLSEVQRRAGHTTIKTTSDIYGHLVPGDGDKASVAMNRIMTEEE